MAPHGISEEASCGTGARESESEKRETTDETAWMRIDRDDRRAELEALSTATGVSRKPETSETHILYGESDQLRAC